MPLVLAVRFEDGRQRHPNDHAPELPAAAVRALIRSDPAAAPARHPRRPAASSRRCTSARRPTRRPRIWWDICWIWGPPEDHLQTLLAHGRRRALRVRHRPAAPASRERRRQARPARPVGGGPAAIEGGNAEARCGPMSSPSEREHHRILYPTAARPHFVIRRLERRGDRHIRAEVFGSRDRGEARHFRRATRWRERCGFGAPTPSRSSGAGRARGRAARCRAAERRRAAPDRASRSSAICASTTGAWPGDVMRDGLARESKGGAAEPPARPAGPGGAGALEPWAISTSGAAGYARWMAAQPVAGVAVWAHTGRGPHLVPPSSGGRARDLARGLPDRVIVAGARDITMAIEARRGRADALLAFPQPHDPVGYHQRARPRHCR